MEPDYPDFDVAEQRFCAFLANEGVPPSGLLYITPADVALVQARIFVRPPAPSARERARNSYIAAVSERRGVLLGAFCAVETAICAYVYGPRDDDEAERLMFGNGLKLSAPVPLRTATPVDRHKMAPRETRRVHGRLERCPQKRMLQVDSSMAGRRSLSPSSV